MKKGVLSVLLVAALMMCFQVSLAATELEPADEIEEAINKGLEWLAAQQYPDGSWEDFEKVGYTGLALKKFEHHAVADGISPLDPAYMYYSQVKRGLNYLFSQVVIIPISPQPAGDPDSDHDGIGLHTSGWHRTYETGIALMAIAESACKDSVVNVPGSPVHGWTYYDVAVDMVDYLVFAQNDAGPGRGGWGYTDFEDDSAWSDNSNSGYAALGLAFAQAPAPVGFNIPMPQFLLDELSIWIDYIQCDAAGSDDGGSGYSDPCGWVNVLKTGNLLFELALIEELDGPRLDRAIAYLVRHWNDPNQDPGWQNHYQAMFCIMKGMEFQGIEMIDAIDWYADFSDQIVATQNPDGSWGPDPWGTEVAATAWAMLTLEKAAPPPPVTYVYVDIKPTSCPNPLNVKPYSRDESGHGHSLGGPAEAYEVPEFDRGTPQGVLPVAVLGTEEFDVRFVDPASILLNGVMPLRWNYEDVATPVEDTEFCACTTEGPDGFMDLTLKFSREEIIETLGPVSDGEVIPLTLTGLLYDSTDIEGTDCVVIRAKRGMDDDARSQSGSAPITVGNNYPNPFNPVTEISFELGAPSHITFEIYNVLGQRVTTLYDGFAEAGEYLIQWDATDENGVRVSSGVYFYRLIAGDVVETRKMLLLK